MDVKRKISEYIDCHQEEMTTLLASFVKENSVQGNEQGIQRLVIQKLEQLGLEIDSWEPSFEEMKHHPYFISNRTSFNGSSNVVGTLKGSGGGKSIILNGHIDVVPEGDLNQWEDDPYSGIIKGNRLYGRGSTDMKGGNVALLLAIEAIKNSGITLKGDIFFQSVIEEESGGAGTLATLLRGYHADGALIPEPSKMKIFPKQQGSAWFRLTVKGKSAHGGTRYEGVSAIEKALIVIHHVLALEKHRNEKINDSLYARIPIPLPINIGVINGGQWPSSVCDEVVLEGRFGIAPWEEIGAAKKQLEAWLLTLQMKDSWFIERPVFIEWFGAHWIPGNLENDHPFLTSFINSYTDVVQEEPIIEASPWGTDGGLLSVVGDIPTIVFGPGETKMAHYPNEYIELDQIVVCAKIIAHFLLDWCGVKEEG
ncbi:MAG: peptidase [Bacillaceae bacterium]